MGTGRKKFLNNAVLSIGEEYQTVSVDEMGWCIIGDNVAEYLKKPQPVLIIFSIDNGKCKRK